MVVLSYDLLQHTMTKMLDLFQNKVPFKTNQQFFFLTSVHFGSCTNACKAEPMYIQSQQPGNKANMQVQLDYQKSSYLQHI